MDEIKCESTVRYCYGCLSDNNEKQIQDYAFVCNSLKEIIQMQSVPLCYLCKRIAQHTELFIQNVLSNQILLNNFSNERDEALKSVKLQTQPLVNLKYEAYEVLELCDEDSTNVEESYSVVSVRREDVKVKLEVKEELVGNLEADSVNGDDEVPDLYVKEEDDLPLTFLLKDESESDINNKKLTEISKKKQKVKIDTTNLSAEKHSVKKVYISKQQCMEERALTLQEDKFLELTYKCMDCVKGFIYKESYDKHMEQHNKSAGKFKCDICKQRMGYHRLVAHRKQHLVRFKCRECGAVYKWRKSVREHYKKQHLALSQHVCEHCRKTFRSAMNLRRHLSYSHGAAQRVQCAYCARSSANKTVLRAHMMRMHPREVGARARFACASCGARFPSRAALRQHELAHTDKRDHYCVECDKSFKSESILKTHLNTAAVHVTFKERPLACQQCEKRFTNRRNLERHTNSIHLNVRPFCCDTCDKAYATSWSLKKHKQYVHEGYTRPRQYPCSMCDKVFDSKHILKSHVRTHTGERPYCCDKCPAQFAQSGVLHTHNRLVHLKLTRDGRPKADAKLK